MQNRKNNDSFEEKLKSKKIKWYKTAWKTKIYIIQFTSIWLYLSLKVNYIPAVLIIIKDQLLLQITE